MDQNLILRTGKYAGYSVREAYSKDPSYIRWVIDNVPAMLKSHGPKKPEAKKPYVYKQPPEDDPSVPGKYIKPGTVEDAFF